MSDDHVPDSLPPSLLISDAHRALLEQSAISLDVATRIGVRSAELPADLPDEAQDLAMHTPGLLFPLRDREGLIAWQIRPDRPQADPATGKPRKYILQAGVGSFLTVHPPMDAILANLDAVKTVLVVEGTKQTIAAVSWVDDDVLVLGVQGCWGWSSGGNPIPDFAGIVEGRPVVVAFDADIATNASVHAAAVRLGDHLKSVGAREVRWLRTRKAPDEGKPTEGLDDWLATRPDKAAALRDAIKRAAKRIPAAPVRRSVSTCVADIDDKCVRSENVVIGDVVEKGSVVLGALPRIVTTTVVVDDLSAVGAPVIEHEMEVAIAGRPTPAVVTVNDRVLNHPRDWLALIRDGSGTTVTTPTDRKTEIEVGNFIRTYDVDNRRFEVGLTRTGWYIHDGQPVWVHCGGAIGKDGAVDGIRSYLSGMPGLVSLPDPSTIPDVGADVRAVLDVANHLVDPTPWWALLGAVASSEAAITPRGALLIAGEPGSGKTHLAKVATSMLNPRFGPQAGGVPMATMDGTQNAVMSSGNGLHHCFVLVDDARDFADRERSSQHRDAFDGLIRRAYGGGGAGKRRMTLDESGRIVERASDLSHPFIILTSEYVPSAASARSTVERLLSIEVSATSTFKPGETKLVERYAAEGALWRANAAYIQWIANEMVSGETDPGMALEHWPSKVEAVMAQVRSELDSAVPDNIRVREVVYPLIDGIGCFFAFAAGVAGYRAEDLRRQARDVIQSLVAAAIEHRTVQLGADSESHMALIRSLVGVIASGDAWLSPDSGTTDLTSSRSGHRIGRYITVDDIEAVAILPEAVPTVLRDWSANDVRRSLKKVAIRGSDGKLTRSVRIDQTWTRCICVPKAMWEAQC
jgi:hypothetical protein